jgi:tetratricopeptide (TPR) repeat protein
MYGFICGYGGEYAQALESARRAVELDSESYLARFALAEVLRVTGKFEESVVNGELALALSGRHALSPTALAVVAAEAAREKEAISHARDAFKIRDPECLFCPLQARAHSHPVIRIPHLS